MDRKIKGKIIGVLVCVVAYIVFAVLYAIEDVRESIRINLIFPIISFMTKFTNNFSFSLFEVLMFLLVLVILILLILGIINFVKKNKTGGVNKFLSIVIILLVFGLDYYIMVGTIYKREELPILNNNNYTDEKYIEIIKKYNEKMEAVAQIVDKDEDGFLEKFYTDAEIKNEILKAYKNANLNSYKENYFLDCLSLAKPIVFSKLMSLNGIIGITFIPTGEANYNSDTLFVDKVYSIAHELAHTIGVMDEEEANVLSLFVLLSSDNIYLKYTGYYFTFSYAYDVLVLLNSTEAKKEFQINDIFIKESERREAFQSKNNKLENIGNFINNLYLKFLGKDGTSSYQSDPIYSYDSETKKYNIESFSKMQRMIFTIYD